MLAANVEHELAIKIAGAIGMHHTTYMGKYLGVQTIQGRVTNSMFNPLLDRINTKLDGWKMKYLSLAGRQVMALSVLATIPYYTMQVTALPSGVCEAIDMKVRNFIWGSKEGERKIHNIR